LDIIEFCKIEPCQTRARVVILDSPLLGGGRNRVTGAARCSRFTISSSPFYFILNLKFVWSRSGRESNPQVPCQDTMVYKTSGLASCPTTPCKVLEPGEGFKPSSVVLPNDRLDHLSTPALALHSCCSVLTKRDRKVEWRLIEKSSQTTNPICAAKMRTTRAGEPPALLIFAALFYTRVSNRNNG
jgi:hypothetical protein